MKNLLLLILMASSILACSKKYSDTIDLSGEWRFQVDSLDAGVRESWFKKTLDDLVTLPGSMTTNGKGNEVSVQTKWTGGVVDSSWYHDDKYAKYRTSENLKIPFWLQPKKYYVGAAWYQKTIEIPDIWANNHVELFLERCHWETQVWVDDQLVGKQNSLAAPHIYVLTNYLSVGKHQISIKVDNRIKDVDPGINSHSIADHTQSNWNGVVGRIELSAKPKIHLKDIQVFPDVVKGEINIKGRIVKLTPNEENGQIIISSVLNREGANPPKIQLNEKIDIGKPEQDFNYTFSLGDELGIWDESYPNLYGLNVSLETDQGIDEQQVTFGMRNFRVDSTWFVINGRPIFLRGTLECAIFPLTGHPPTDKQEWKRIFNVVKSHGLNHVRFHSWCPPEAAFAAADELGIYLQVECSSWANQSTTLGDGLPIDQFVLNESERIIKTFGNHPSFCLMAYGNEPGGNNYNEYLTNFVSYWKEKDDRRVYTGGAGWPVLEENQYHNLPQPRIQGWGEELKSIINSEKPQTAYDWADKIKSFDVPVVSHEIGQWCVYPSFKEIKKYTGVLKPKNFEIFQETLKVKRMAHLSDSFLLASGKLQTLCYKADIEAALRTPGFAGFQLLDLHDFPGQGTALVGVLDPFWEQKGYVTPEEYSRFCNSTVPLARLKKRVFQNTEYFEADIEVAHFGDEELASAVSSWRITDQQNAEIFHGSFDTTNIPIGNCLAVGSLSVNLDKISTPKQLTLTVNISGFENDWDFWVYPVINEPKSKIHLTGKLDQESIAILDKGGSVLWSIPKETKGKNLNNGIGFSSIFWNTAWTGGQKPHSLGILCNPNHPAFDGFPTDYHSNWQWWDAMSHANAIAIDDLQLDIQPIVRVIDDWFENRSQVLLMEIKVGNGKIIVSGVDFFENMDSRLAGRQLLHSLTKYMESNSFDPKIKMTANQLGELL